MVTIAHFSALLRTDAEHIEIDIERWFDLLAAEPADEFDGQLQHSGWSPVEYDPPKRSIANVKRIYALVLDHDAGGEWDALVKLWTGTSGVVYTTKSDGHYRVALALERPVTPEEYARIWQWAAARSLTAGCPVDQQCKDASRFWYTPTLPPSGWRAERLQGAAIDPDAIIALAPPPTLRVVPPPRPAPDTSERMRRARAYLARIPGAVSGAGGHPATFNAVCHMMFGFDLSDEDTLSLISTDYNPRCDPPWSERELQHKITSARKQCHREPGYLLTDRPRITSTTTAASHAPAAADIEADWQQLLLTNEKRQTKRAYHNTAVFVRHHPEFRGRWSMDTMTNMPWFNGLPIEPGMVHYIRAQADCRLGYTPPVGDVEAAITAAAMDRPFHPIRQYLRSLDWDGTPRLHAMARDYLGSADALHADMVRRWMIGAAARALWPGCKLDTTLMLVGDQGLGKSTFFAVLGGQWHADSFIDISSKDGAMQLHAAWIYELSELENVVTGAKESRLKAWLTSTHDLYRAPYGKVTESKPRAVSICGTTNRKQFLTDDTGSRRFWIVMVRQRVPVAVLRENRDQLWAEAVCAAESGEPWWFDDRAENQRETANQSFTEEDSWTDPVSAFLSSPMLLDRTSVTEVLSDALKLDLGRHDRQSQTRVARILKALGWHKSRDTTGWPRKYYYIRGTAGTGVLRHESDSPKTESE